MACMVGRMEEGVWRLLRSRVSRSDAGCCRMGGIVGPLGDVHELGTSLGLRRLWI